MDLTRDRAVVEDGGVAMQHAPRWSYDCKRCKFSWCCGATCACLYESVGGTPRKRQDEVDAALVKLGMEPQFRSKSQEAEDVRR